MSNSTATGSQPPPAGAASAPPPEINDPAGPSLTPQLDRSRALNSEGLEGLIPRATLLIQTGGSFFLAFLPFMLIASILFTILFYARSPSTCL